MYIDLLSQALMILQLGVGRLVSGDHWSTARFKESQDNHILNQCFSNWQLVDETDDGW